LDLRVVDLNGIIAHTLSLVRHELGKKHITLVRELADDLPETKLDENKTQQVVLNICMNSIHAMPGGGQLRVKTRRDLSPAGQTLVVIEVEDTGPGIPADKLAKVFDPFFSTKSFGKGHGLGLSIAKQIVELHRGTIELRNRPEGGVKVTMAFPQ
jgi:signal transduction histidine kinase